MKFSLRSMTLLLTVATVATWFLVMQPWREERFRPFSEYQHELNSQKLRIELSAGGGQSGFGVYIKKDGDRLLCLAIGSHRWNFEAGPEDYTYTYGTLQRSGAFIDFQKQWGCDDLPDRVVAVTWGPRHYLLFENELEAFRRAVDTGAEPRKTLEGAFFMLDGDQSKPTFGEPDFFP